MKQKHFKQIKFGVTLLVLELSALEVKILFILGISEADNLHINENYHIFKFILSLKPYFRCATRRIGP